MSHKDHVTITKPYCIFARTEDAGFIWLDRVWKMLDHRYEKYLGLTPLRTYQKSKPEK